MVSSAIVASGKVGQILPDIWKIAFAGNDAQFARNLPVVRDTEYEPRGVLPLAHLQRNCPRV
jgi:hypothetical protein